MTRPARLLAVVQAGLPCAGRAIAEDAQGERTITLFQLGCSVRHWSADDGLPVSDVRCIEVGRQGYLWIGTSGGGVARFNGFEFTPMFPNLPPEARLPKVTDMLFQSSGRRKAQRRGPRA